VLLWWISFLLSLLLVDGLASGSSVLVTLFLLVPLALTGLGSSRRARRRRCPRGRRRGWRSRRVPSPRRRARRGRGQWRLLPEDLQAWETLVLRTAPGPVPSEPSPAPTIDVSGPFEAQLLEPPGLLQRVRDDPAYAGAYDLERLLAGVPAAEREQARASLRSFGLVRAQQAAFANQTAFLEVSVLEFETAASAAERVAAGAEGESTFPVDVPGGVGHRAYELDLLHPGRQTTDEAVLLLRLQREAAAA
jgi:hypothetical protein